MPLKLEWVDVEQSIMCCMGEGEWDWDEYHTALDQIVEHFRQTTQRVDLIIDRAPNSVMPSGSQMPHFQRAMRIMPENVGLVVIVSSNSFGRAIVSIFSKIYPSRDNAKLMLVASLDDALNRIARHRREKIAVA